MSALDDIFGSLVISPEQRMRLRAHEAQFRTGMREQAADETRKADQADKLDADMTRVEMDTSNRKHFVAYQCGAACVVRDFGDEP